MALSTVLSVLVPSHEDTSATLWSWTLTSKTLKTTVCIDLVVLENGHLGLLALVLDLLWSSVLLLLPLLGTSSQTKHQVKSRLLLDVVVGKSATVLELLSSEDETLLVGGNALLVLDLGLDVIDGIAGLNLKGDSLASQGFDDCYLLVSILFFFHLDRGGEKGYYIQICIPPRRRRTRWRVDSFWML